MMDRKERRLYELILTYPCLKYLSHGLPISALVDRDVPPGIFIVSPPPIVFQTLMGLFSVAEAELLTHFFAHVLRATMIAAAVPKAPTDAPIAKSAMN